MFTIVQDCHMSRVKTDVETVVAFLYNDILSDYIHVSLDITKRNTNINKLDIGANVINFY